jgi:hypothetical protein
MTDFHWARLRHDRSACVGQEWQVVLFSRCRVGPSRESPLRRLVGASCKQPFSAGHERGATALRMNFKMESLPGYPVTRRLLMRKVGVP